jgi:hypothetical protein
MRKLSLLVIAVAFMLTAIAPSSAFALGNCGGFSSSPQNMLKQWQRLGVTSDGYRLIRSGGYSSTDYPSIARLVSQRGIKAPLAHATLVRNTACGGGRMVPFGSKVRPKGYPMAVMLPQKYSKGDLCHKRSRTCHSVKVKVFAFGQLLCDNGTHQIVVVVILVKVHKAKPKPKKPVLTCEAQGLITVAGNCVTQSQWARMQCESKGSGYQWDQNTNQCQQIQVVCGNVVIISGDNNNVTQGGNCDTQQPPCSCTPPPCSTCTPPPPSPPAVSNVTQPQEGYVHETYPNFKANVTAPAGDAVKVVVGARFGVGYTMTITSSGADTVTGTYTAPTDLPFVWTPPSWSGFTTADTWEQVHVVATDLTTGLSSTGRTNVSTPDDQQAYVWFPIRRPPANP